MNIFLIDEHTLFREGMQWLLRPLADSLELTHFDACEQALKLPGNTPAPDLILKDWHRGASSFLALRALCDRFPRSPAVVVSGESNPELIRKIIAHGAAGFIPKKSTAEALVGALRQVLRGEAFVPLAIEDGRQSRTGAQSRQPRLLEVASSWPDLTARQIDVFQGALMGLTNKEIARELSITDGTVKQHLSAIYQVLGVTSRSEAVSVAARRGIRANPGV
ncbi:MAG: hypothetical protein RIS34_1429 [Pseudomonadota bacterium]|jgi:DNA-binding NarL/FixJ family response regulator